MRCSCCGSQMYRRCGRAPGVGLGGQSGGSVQGVGPGGVQGVWSRGSVRGAVWGVSPGGRSGGSVQGVGPGGRSGGVGLWGSVWGIGPRGRLCHCGSPFFGREAVGRSCSELPATKTVRAGGGYGRNALLQLIICNYCLANMLYESNKCGIYSYI